MTTDGENAAKYAINFANNCPYNIFVKAYTAIANQHVQDGGNLGPGKKGQINVPNNYNDVEIFPLKNCKGAGGTQCESGGCKSVSFKIANNNNPQKLNLSGS